MWGGIKSRRSYAEVFRRWSASKPVEDVRSAIPFEPRPWYLGFSLHEHRHYLTDHHCSRLLSWCVTLVRLEKDLERKKSAYRYSHNLFDVFLHSHQVGEETFLELIRLCHAGRDVTAASQFYQFMLEARGRGASPFLFLACMARVALSSPSAERTEQLALGIMRQYRSFETQDAALPPSSETPWEPSVEQGHRTALHAIFVLLKSRVRHPQLLQFIEGLPMTEAEARQHVAVHGWPHRAHHHTFLQLDGEVGRETPTAQRPALSDSLLHPLFVERLEAASFQHKVEEVIALLKYFESRILQEKEANSHATTPLAAREPPIWRQPLDASAQHFRQRVVQSGGLTPELYHYLVVALCAARPSAALRTIKRMKTAHLRVLDVTRGVMIISAKGDRNAQTELLREQLDEIAAREKLDEDHGVNTLAELYWKYDYVNFFHYRNGFTLRRFYKFLMDRLGPVEVQDLVWSVSDAEVKSDQRDFVVVNAPFRQATEEYMLQQFGEAEINQLLDGITQDIPQLDIGLIGSLPHFDTFALPECDNISTDLSSLKQRFQGYDTVYIVDASFVETSDGFLHLGQRTTNTMREADTLNDDSATSLVLFPYMTLKQLSQSVWHSKHFISFDAEIQEDIVKESQLASQRLRTLCAMLMSRPSSDWLPSKAVHARPLYFSETLLSQMMDLSSIKRLGLDPLSSEDDRFILVLSLIRAVTSASTRLVLCSDDTKLNEKLDTVVRSAPEAAGGVWKLFSGAVDVLTTSPPPNSIHRDGEVLVDDNPVLNLDVEAFLPVVAAPPVLEPSSEMAHRNTKNSSSARNTAIPRTVVKPIPPLNVDSEFAAVESPWLQLLGDDVPAVDHHTTDRSSSALREVPEESPFPVYGRRLPSSSTVSPNPTYKNPHDVVPAQQEVREASKVLSVFDEFGVLDPEELKEKEEERLARRSRLALSGPHGKASGPRPSVLRHERAQHQGVSKRQRARMARGLSNDSGGRVPFNLRYHVVQVNINDRRNRHVMDLYHSGVQRKRAEFLQKQQPV